MDRYISGTGQRLNVHEKRRCQGEHCLIHNPSEHHMRGFPTNWRADRGIMERVCPHGVGHPDPDDLEYRRLRARAHPEHAFLADDLEGVHACDGCCGA